jgi:hypothetical protein
MFRTVLCLSVLLCGTLLAASCGESPLNTELDPSGTYQMTVEYTDSDMPCTLTLIKNEDGFLKAIWDYGDEDGTTYENTAVCFGEKYLAICEPGDPPILDVFTVGDGALNGFWAEYGYDDLLRVYGTTEEGNPLPDPPVLMDLENTGNYELDGDNPDGSFYVGYSYLESFGKVIGCDQTITPDTEADEYYWGVGVIIDDYFVLAVSSFLSVYTPSGDDWHGVLTDYSDDIVTDENLTYIGE